MIEYLSLSTDHILVISNRVKHQANPSVNDISSLLNHSVSSSSHYHSICSYIYHWDIVSYGISEDFCRFVQVKFDLLQVQFIPYVVSRASRRHTKSRKHRFFHGLNRKS